MQTTELFTKALGVAEPWYVEETEFKDNKSGEKELHIYIGFKKGSKWKCPTENCEEQNSAYDTRKRVWRHLNFFQYKTYIHANQPRFKCPVHGTHFIPVPWARNGSGFTLLFEAMCLEMAKTMPVSQVANFVGEHDTRLWNFIEYYVDEARKSVDLSEVESFGVDETSKKGHNYITVFVDLKKKNVIYVTDGKDHSTVDKFAEDFKNHKGNPDKITDVTCDMSLGFKKGITENFPNSSLIIDKFHVIKHMNEAVDKVRKEESKNNPILKNTKYIWLKNESNLTEKQLEKKDLLSKKKLKTARAYSMRLTLQEIYETCDTKDDAVPLLKKLCSWMDKSRLAAMKDFSNLLKSHFDDIANYFDNKLTNAILEGTNNIIQNIKVRARGFKNPKFFETMIFLVCGNLDFKPLFP